MHAIADERSHGHPAMLDLSMAEPADGLLKVVLRLVEDAERVPVDEVVERIRYRQLVCAVGVSVSSTHTIMLITHS